MSHVFADFNDARSSTSSPSFCSQSTIQPASRTITPTQCGRDNGGLRPSASDEDPRTTEGSRPQLSASTAAHLLDLPHVDVEAGWERERQKERAREANQDKFSTLFEPSTPRASPTLMPESLPKVNYSGNSVSLFGQSAPLGSHRSRPRPGSISSGTGSDFGSFVEVTASEDPLSLVLQDEDDNDATVLSTRELNRPSVISTSSRVHSNTTLDFFDLFTHDAKRRSSAARSQFLDELLLHEDDPMWFTLDNKEEDIKPPSITASPTLPDLTSISNDPTNLDDEISLLQDIDHEYFRPLLRLSPTRSRSTSPIVYRRPSRSNSILPPVIAPPIACQLTVSPPATGDSHGGDYQDFDPLADTLETKDSSFDPSTPDSTERSSHNSVSSLSSKLMLSLLRARQDSSPSSTLTSRLADSPLDRTPERDEVTGYFGSPRVASPSSSKTIPKLVRGSSHADPLPTRRTNHHFAFDPIKHTTSPFAASFYVPPSGAPGFKGDRYDWDKGYSDELGSEQRGSPSLKGGYSRSEGDGIEITSASAGSSRSSSRISGSLGWSTGLGFGFGSVRGQPQGQTSRSSPPDSRKIGSGSADPQDGKDHDGESLSKSSVEFGSLSLGGMTEAIERKIGSIELVGRKASSTPVLMPELASMLRTHLPALSRLPRSWPLIYSLDQHGISLNTLYSRCESHLLRKSAPGEFGVSKGMLLAIKDVGADDDDDDEHRALFGAWIAEGLKLNKGKGYSGGGESFLWKYADGDLKVFKTTGLNSYVALCEPEYLSFGGGDGHYGLYLDESLFEGSSAHCPTFDNEPLCSGAVVGNLKTVKFECVGLEVWGMG